MQKKEKYYLDRIKDLDLEIEKLSSIISKIGWLRLIVLLLGGVTAWKLYENVSVYAGILVITFTIILFIVVVNIHGKKIKQKDDFEIARDFRNEGISVNHLQDFTMVEGYSAYWNFEDNMKLMQDMVVYIISNLFDGNLKVQIGDQEIDFGGEWDVVSFRDLLIKDCSIDIDKFTTAKELLTEIRKNKIELEVENLETLGRGNLIDQLYKKVSRPKIIKPTFLINHPIDLSPLARANDENPELTDRFQLIVNGQEIINGYSELVDSVEQQKRFLEQSKLKENGDEEAMSYDYEYIKAMEYGMPPISGWGLGIDRFLQFLTNSYNIRDVVLYPLLKPRENVEQDDEEE